MSVDAGDPAQSSCELEARPAGQWTLPDDLAVALHRYAAAHARARARLAAGDRGVRMVVHSVTRGDPTGGLGDRLNGILTSFYLAVLTDRAFFIHWDKPVPLTTFLVPGGPINWVPDPRWLVRAQSAERLQYTDRCAELRRLLSEPGDAPPFAVGTPVALLTVSTNCNMVDVLFASPLYRATAACAALWPAYARGDLFPFAFTTLFKPSCVLANAVAGAEAALFDHAGRRIGVHVRTGLDPSFRDPARSTLVIADQARVFANATVRLALALSAAAPPAAGESVLVSSAAALELDGTTTAVFVVTDSAAMTAALADALHQVAPTVTVVSLPIDDALPLTHIDHNGTPDARDHVRTFLEWSLYRRMDAMVVARSMYSLQASRAACVPAVEVHALQAGAEVFSGLLGRGCCISAVSWANVTEDAKRFCDYQPHWE